MSTLKIFDIVGSAMSAQSVRLNTIASNMANAEATSSDPNTVYKAHMPVFKTVSDVNSPDASSVKVTGIVENQAPADKRYEPGNPMADKDGYIYGSNVNVVEEMVNMISASRSYQGSVEVMNTAKELALRTLALGK